MGKTLCRPLSQYSPTRTPLRWGFVLGVLPNARLLRCRYQHVGIVSKKSSGPNAKPGRPNMKPGEPNAKPVENSWHWPMGARVCFLLAMYINFHI